MCGTYEEEEKYVQSFGGERGRKRPTRKT